MKVHSLTTWLRLTLKYSVPTSIATITVKDGATFHVHKDVLTDNSAYFDKALNGPFVEGRTQSINLDDVSSHSFGLYICNIYKIAALSDGEVKLRAEDDSGASFYSWEELLGIWKLADRFLSPKLLELAQKALQDRFQAQSVQHWARRYTSNKWETLNQLIGDMQTGFRLCKVEGIPFEKDFVAAVSNCPPQMFAKIIGQLDADLRSAAIEAFALRFADRQITKERKRKMENDEYEQKSAKKQRKD